MAKRPAAKNKLKAFLVEAARDPRKWAAFEEDPEAVMTAAGLSKSQQAALMSRNAERIRKALGAGPRAFMLVLLRFR